MKLTDPWFEASFIGEMRAGGYRYLDSIEGAQGLFLWCPCGAKKPEFQTPDGGRPHGVLVTFTNPRHAPAVSDADCVSHNRDGAPTRWTMQGTSLDDLTLTPSIDVGKPSCFHGYITNGDVTSC